MTCVLYLIVNYNKVFEYQNFRGFLGGVVAADLKKISIPPSLTSK